jgi:hypothetical protein
MMTVEDHLRRCELISRKYCGQQAAFSVLDPVRPAPYLPPREQLELDWLEEKLQLSIKALPLK